MKKTCIILLSLFSLIACTQDNPLATEENQNTNPENTDPQNPGTDSDLVFTLSALPAEDPAVNLPDGGASKVTLEWDEPWTVSASESWLTVFPTKGSAGKHSVYLTSARNEDSSAREAVVTVSSANGNRTLIVRQNPNIYKTTFLRTKKVHWSFSWTYDNSSRISRTRLAMPYPESSAYQGIRDRTCNSEAVLRTSPEGVKYLLYDHSGSNAPASGEICLEQDFTVDYYDVRVNFDLIENQDIPYDTKSSAYKRYTSQIRDENSTLMIDPRDSRIVSTSNALWEQAGGNRLEYAYLCHKWVIENISYGIYDGPNSVDDILNRMSGDCGNQHAIWMSLMRAAGIPARPIVMNAPNPNGYSHVRGEFYIPGYGWIPVDPTNEQGTYEDYFGAFKDEPLVIMNRDFGFTGVDANNKTFIIGLLQGISVVIWGGGNFDGNEEFTFVN